jgi:uncharacterized membrane protein YfcA
MSLIIVGVVSLVGILPHWRQGNINFKTAILFAPTAMVGAYLGARIATLPLVTTTFQLMSFAVMMLVAAFFMLRKSARSEHWIQEDQPKAKTVETRTHHQGMPLVSYSI